MVIITDMKSVCKIQADAKFAIVRSYRRPVPGVAQMAAISPSWDLFRAYLAMRDSGNWNETAFREIYVPRFLSEVKKSKPAKDALNKIWYASEKENKTIALACFCADERLCHRHIIGSLLSAAGAEVRMGTPPDKDYAAMYGSIQ